MGVTQPQLDRHPENTGLLRLLDSGVGFWILRFWQIPLLECCKFKSGLFVPVAALRVTIWHRTRLSSAAACQSHAGRVSATRRGGITFSLRAFWKCELASFPCRKVLTILYQPLLLFLVFSVDSCVFGSAVRNF